MSWGVQKFLFGRHFCLAWNDGGSYPAPTAMEWLLPSGLPDCLILKSSDLLAMLQVGSSDIKGSDTLKAIRIPWGISSAPQLAIYAKRQ
jgi:hypothetical protein